MHVPGRAGDDGKPAAVVRASRRKTSHHRRRGGLANNRMGIAFGISPTLSVSTHRREFRLRASSATSQRHWIAPAGRTDCTRLQSRPSGRHAGALMRINRPALACTRGFNLKRSATSSRSVSNSAAGLMWFICNCCWIENLSKQTSPDSKCRADRARASRCDAIRAFPWKPPAATTVFWPGRCRVRR